ncbi:MAG: hypothetical protein PVH18_11985, partial [Chloroflexota bacterium]
GIRPTYTWARGERLQDAYAIPLDEGLAPGDYELSVGMYDVYTAERLPAYDGSGQRLPEDRVILGTVTVLAD